MLQVIVSPRYLFSRDFQFVTVWDRSMLVSEIATKQTVVNLISDI